MVGQKVYIDKTGLEDAINFQDIEFEIVDGYYYDEGRNNTINTVIQHLYNKRIKKEQESSTDSYKRINEVYVW